MAKNSGNTRNARNSKSKSNSINVDKYLTDVEKDFAFLHNENPEKADGKLVGSVLDNARDLLTNAILEIKNIDSVTKLRQFEANVEKEYRKTIKQIEEQKSLLEHNAQIAKGRAKRTYQQAIETLSYAQYELNTVIKHGTYNIQELAKIEEQLIRNNKW